MINIINNIIKKVSTPLSVIPRLTFSEYFVKKDQLQMDTWLSRKQWYLPYLRRKQQWQIPLAKKKLRQQRIQAIKATKKRREKEAEKLIIHNPAVGIQYPLINPQSFFCIVNIDGHQFKIMQNCRIILPNRQSMQINDKVVFQKVMLLASKDFTVIGRPFLESVKIDAVVQQKLLSEKTIIFKKKRRKQYHKNYGLRVKLTVLRVNKIEYTMKKQQLKTAVALE